MMTGWQGLKLLRLFTLYDNRHRSERTKRARSVGSELTLMQAHHAEKAIHAFRLYRYKSSAIGGNRWKETWMVVQNDGTILWFNDKSCAHVRGMVPMENVTSRLLFGESAIRHYKLKSPSPPFTPTDTFCYVVILAGKKPSFAKHYWFYTKTRFELVEFWNAVATYFGCSVDFEYVIENALKEDEKEENKVQRKSSTEPEICEGNRWRRWKLGIMMSGEETLPFRQDSGALWSQVSPIIDRYAALRTVQQENDMNVVSADESTDSGDECNAIGQKFITVDHAIGKPIASSTSKAEENATSKNQLHNVSMHGIGEHFTPKWKEEEVSDESKQISAQMARKQVVTAVSHAYDGECPRNHSVEFDKRKIDTANGGVGQQESSTNNPARDQVGTTHDRPCKSSKAASLLHDNFYTEFSNSAGVNEATASTDKISALEESSTGDNHTRASRDKLFAESTKGNETESTNEEDEGSYERF